MSPAATAAQDQETAWHPENTETVVTSPSTQWCEVTEVRGDDWAQSALRRLSDLGSLPDDWDGFGSPRISRDVFEVAFKLMRVLIEYENLLPSPAVVPTSGGGLQFEWINQAREFEIEVRPDGSLAALSLDEDGEADEEPVITQDDLLSRLIWVMAA